MQNTERPEQTLESHGATAGAPVAADAKSGSGTPVAHRRVVRMARYCRTLPAPPHRAFDAVVHTVEALRYPLSDKNPATAEVRFSALCQTVTVTVVDEASGHSTLVVEFKSFGWGAIGGSALVILPGVLLGGVVKAHDAYFAKGFLDNVQRVLDGRGVGWDSGRVPGLTALRESLELADP